jgi:hypothetical protein
MSENTNTAHEAATQHTAGENTTASDNPKPLTDILGKDKRANLARAYGAEEATVNRIAAVSEPAPTTVDAELAQEFAEMATQTYSNETLSYDDLRVDESEYEEEAAEEVPSYSVRKPGKYDFIRVNPDPKYKIHVAIIEDKDNRDEGVHLVLPSVKTKLARADYETCTLYTYQTREGGIYLWKVKTSGIDGKHNKWYDSANKAVRLAQESWVRITSGDQQYRIKVAGASKAWGEPEWPTMPMIDMLTIAFEGRIIRDLNHPVILKKIEGSE